MDILKLGTIVSNVRKEFTENRISREKLKKLYQKYNPLQDIDLFLNKSNKLFPKLNCGLASIYLKNKLKKGKLINGKYKKENHTFLLLNNKVIVDITSDQYGGPHVYVGPIEKPWSM